MSASPDQRDEILRHIRAALSSYGHDQANGPRMTVTPDPINPCYLHASLRTSTSTRTIVMHISVEDIETI